MGARDSGVGKQRPSCRVCARPRPTGPALPRPARPRDYTSQATLRGERGRSFQAPVGTRGPRRRRDAMAAWGERLAGVRGVLLDISGVLYDGGEGGGAPIVGSVEAVAR